MASISISGGENETETGDSQGATDTDASETTTHPVEPRQPPAEGPSLDIIFSILKNQRRRWVLSYLNEHETRVTLSDLSEYVAGLENDKPPTQLSSQERKRAYVGLYQCHLPMMDDAGIIEYNKDRGWIELTDQSEILDRYLENPDDAPRPWHVYYLAVAGTTAVAAILCLLIPSLPAVGMVGLQAVGLGLLALVHGWQEGLLESVGIVPDPTTSSESV